MHHSPLHSDHDAQPRIRRAHQTRSRDQIIRAETRKRWQLKKQAMFGFLEPKGHFVNQERESHNATVLRPDQFLYSHHLVAISASPICSNRRSSHLSNGLV
jgi:hypothetical protein